MATDFVSVVEQRPDSSAGARQSLSLSRAAGPRHRHRRRVAVLTFGSVGLPTAALAVVATVHAVGMNRWPSYGNDDEGTYLARAWAVQTGLGAHHGPAPYTYWYDHPPFGWIQLSLWTWLTHTFRAGTVAVASGRMDMLLYTIVCTALVYVIARRLGCSIPIAVGAMLLFGLSPLSVESLRIVMLDTIGLPWVLGAFALGLSPRRKLWAFAGSGLCMAVGILSKETYLLLVPALVWLVWQRSKGPTRAMCVAAFVSVSTCVLAFYPLYAALKGELLPGHGHVSLIGAIEWQLHGRAGSGSIFKTGTDAHMKILEWIHVDPWLLGLGAASMPVLFVRRFGPIAAAFATFVLFLLRTGYLPAEYVTGALPFAALTVACATEALWNWSRRLPRSRHQNHLQSPLHGRSRRSHDFRWSRRVVLALLLGLMAAFGALAIPQWVSADHTAMTVDTTSSLHLAESWIVAHIPRSSTLLVDDDVWIDLVDDGFHPNNVVWLWELDLDPQVRSRFPGLWRQMDYVVATGTLRGNVQSAGEGVPSVIQALSHATEIARFGSGSTFVSVYKVTPKHVQPAPWWLPGYGTGKPPTYGQDKGERL